MATNEPLTPREAADRLSRAFGQKRTEPLISAAQRTYEKGPKHPAFDAAREFVRMYAEGDLARIRYPLAAWWLPTEIRGHHADVVIIDDPMYERSNDESR